MTLRENLMAELLPKLRASRERPYPLQAKKPKLKLQQSQKDKVLEEARKLLEGIEEEH